MDDRGDLERFCREAHPRLVGALSHQFGDLWLAEELAQEALVRACDRWGQVRGMASPMGWTFRVALNLGNSQLRRRGAERRARTRHGARRDEHRDADTADRLAVTAALGGLSDQQRAAVVARYFLGLTTHEAAEALRTTPLAVRSATFRALAVLRAELGVDDDDDDEELADVEVRHAR
jgi:RNA polymerase sigma factor (sigma-70 family)